MIKKAPDLHITTKMIFSKPVIVALFFTAAIAVNGAHANAATGSTPDESVVVSLPSTASQSPDIAIGPDGSINIVWLGENAAPPNAAQIARRGHSHDSSTNLYFARSTDGGSSFSTPRQLNPGNGDVWGFSISKPRIAVGPDNRIHIIYPGNQKNLKTGETETIALYLRSDSDITAFDPPRRLNVDALTDQLVKDDGGSFATITVGADNVVYAAWIDTRTMTSGETARAALVVSEDGGKTFSSGFEILPSIVCPCCQLTSLTDRRGRLILGMRLVDGQYRDNEIVTLSKFGRKIESRQRVSDARWALEGCPRKPTAVAVKDDYWAAAYYSGAEKPDGVYTVWSKDAGKSWSAPRAIDPTATLSDAPTMTFAGNRLYLAWHSRIGTEGFRIFVSFSDDGGMHFSAPVALPIPDGLARLPSLAAHSDGSIQIAWQHDRSIRTLRWRGSFNAPSTISAPNAAQ